MQRYILKHKTQIMAVAGGLILLAFVCHFVFHSLRLAEILLVLASLLGLLPIALQALSALRVKVVSIDLLVTIAVLGAFLIRNYEESAIVTFLFLFGAFLEERTLNKTRSAIKELTAMAPQTAWLKEEDGTFHEVDVDDVEEEAVLLVKTGAKVPVDGLVLDGSGSIDEGSITGESLPVEKKAGDTVFAGTILENGSLEILSKKVGEDTTFGRIIELVEEAQDSKSEAERFIDAFAKYYTPAVLIIALVVFLITKKIELAVTILVLGCPGALVIGVPVSNVAGIGNGAKHGILLKGSEVIRDFSRLDTMIFDKTGTLTLGQPKVSESLYFGPEAEKNRVYEVLGSIEGASDHPLAKATLAYLGPIHQQKVENLDVMKGGGVSATIAGQKVLVGNARLLQTHQVSLDEDQIQGIQDLENKGNSLVITAINGQVRSILGIKDLIRPGVAKDLQKLRQLGVKNLVLLSGDNQRTVDLVAQELGLTEAHGGLLPEDKAKRVKERMSKGEIVAFVGDGINDSPSLASANIGIAMGSGTDVAIETSDVVLMNSDVSKLPHALGLVKATARNMKQNIIIAVAVVLLLVASLIFSQWMNMSIGMLVHEGSILAVILNGMRLLNYKVKDRSGIL